MNDIIKEKLYNTPETKKSKSANWWDSEEHIAYSDMIQLVKAINENQVDRKWANLRHGYLYQNRQNAQALGGYMDNSAGRASLPDRFNVTYNVVKSAIDTLTSRITANKPRPRVLTEKGDYIKQQRAKRLTKYFDGVLYGAETYRQGVRAFKDGAIFGTGCIKVIPDYNKGCITTERTLISEILIDDLEGMYDNPQSMYQLRLVSKEVLKGMFPEKAMEIDNAAPALDEAQRVHTIDMVPVYEAWHLPDAQGKGGRHIIGLVECGLFDEEWKHSSFPFAFFRYDTNIASFYGQGVAEELVGTQLEINKLLRDIQRAQNLIAVPRVLMEYNSKVIASHLNNEIGSAIKYQGTKPDFFTPTAMNNEIYNHVKWLIETAYEKVGLSRLSATSKKPAGLDSGRAIREFKDNESERFAATNVRYDEFFNDVVKLVAIFSKDLYSNNKDLSITVESKKFIETIKWSDVDLEDDKFVTKVYSSSMFPTQPAAKLQKIEEYVRAGWMDREDAIRLMDFPDVEAWESLETSDRDYVEHIITDILENSKYRPPEPEMLLEKDINIVRKSYIEALDQGVDEDKLELLLRWVEAASSLLPDISPPTPAAATPIAPEQGVALPLPQSGLTPQV